MSKVTEAIKAADALVAQPKGAFDYKKGQTWARFSYYLNNLSLTGLNDIDTVKAFAANSSGAELTAMMANSIIDVVHWQEPVTSFKETDSQGPVESQYNAGILTAKMPAVLSVMAAAKDEIERDVIRAYRRMAVDEFAKDGNPRTKEDKIAGLIAFGISLGDASRCQWSGNTVMDQQGNPIDFFGLAGVKA